MTKLITWEQAISKAHQKELEISGTNSIKAIELGKALLDAENLASIMPKTESPFYGAKARIRASLLGATSKDLKRVLQVAQDMLAIVEAAEDQDRLAADITAQLYNVWKACPNGQTFDEFLKSL